jgi:hypothetical protein
MDFIEIRELFGLYVNKDLYPNFLVLSKHALVSDVLLSASG